MIETFGTIEDFACTVEYLARAVGTASATQLRIIARALGAVDWDLPSPRPVAAAGEVGGFNMCVAASAILRPEAPAAALPYARTLLEKVPGKPAVCKMCYLHDVTARPRGYRLAAVRDDNGTAAYIENPVLGESDACGWLNRGWGCLFVKNGSGREAAVLRR
ncbi:MAG: hypothetical protein JSU81_01510 [Candidatus Coatesbacteria bacterium]|nr:MAG: hypothetical protein JSU81_01510 [Candidatus Coatesbacteria bacterium]